MSDCTGGEAIERVREERVGVRASVCVWAGGCMWWVRERMSCWTETRRGDDDNGNDNGQTEYRFERTKRIQYSRLANRTERCRQVGVEYQYSSVCSEELSVLGRGTVWMAKDQLN